MDYRQVDPPGGAHGTINADLAPLVAERQDPATAVRRACGYLRNATALELAEWFERRYGDSGGTDLAAYEAAAELRSHPGPADRPYADPVYWAGFVYTGP